jgi:ubiquinone/menaquinone biosynthesis C-methylase UbiE
VVRFCFHNSTTKTRRHKEKHKENQIQTSRFAFAPLGQHGTFAAMNPRLMDERDYHDRQAAERAVTFAQQPHRLRFNDADYLDHVPWVRYAFQRLGDVSAQRILDLGCGHGMAAVVMARRGAVVTACDLSPGYCAETMQRSRANEAPIAVVACNGEQLPFANQSFDAIWGHAILHHLDVPTAALEIKRVLRPGGRVVLCEPWNGSPFWRMVRRWRHHTQHEKALDHADLQVLRRLFSVKTKSFQLGRYMVISLS